MSTAWQTGSLFGYQEPVSCGEAVAEDEPVMGLIDPLPRGPELRNPGNGVDWPRLMQQSLTFLFIKHGFRLATEAETRRSLGGPFLPAYADSLRSMHGWADGDPFYVNYIGHPILGSVASRLFAQNDRRYRGSPFGKNRDYWQGRLRAAAFSFAYSAQFEIGPLSEATVGNVQRVWPQHGFGDLVVTPFIGMGWGITEDAIDEYVVRRVERWTTNNWTRLLVRGALNPTRSLANLLAAQTPWHREDRGGVYVPTSYMQRSRNVERERLRPADWKGVAPFEFAMNFQPLFFPSSGVSCLGGDASAAMRISQKWQMVFDVGGCKMSGLEENFSGDSLTYMAGPRWQPAANRRFSPHVQFLLGGRKLTMERFHPDQWERWEMIVERVPNPADYRHHYTQGADSNTLALSTGGGFDIRLNHALSLRLANVEYHRSWARDFQGLSFQDGLRFSTGLVLRIGTW